MPGESSARIGGLWATGLHDVTSDIAALDSRGRWAVALPYSGTPVLARFDTWGHEPVMPGTWTGPSRDAWESSLDESGYAERVERIREEIAAGAVYQANLCRVLSAPMPDESAADIAGLWALLAAGNPSPFGGYLSLPENDVSIASASPELFLSVHADGTTRVARSGPIKGTGRTAADLTEKDVAENIMIVDLVRNDLSRVSDPGTVTVPALLDVEEHPGLVHLVSYVAGHLVDSAEWPSIIEATFPPGSVTGAPKIAAIDLIHRLETEPREFYCGAFGWVDADTGEAELAVAIRTFWQRDGVLRFGTGAGITWGSDPLAEWRETELKAAHLIDVASGTWKAGRP